MPIETMILLALGAICGGFVNGLAGFGTSLFALGFWLQTFPPLQAVSMSVVMGAFTGLQGLWVVRRQIFDNPRRLSRFLIPALFGIPFGIAALAYIDPSVLKLIIAGFLILYGAFFLLRRSLPKFERPTPFVDSGIGLVSGALGGLAGLSGALPAMWCALRPWPRHETRAVLQPFNVTVLLISAVTLAAKGAFDRQTLMALAVALVLATLSAQAGIALFKRLTDTQFRWLVIALMLLSGIVLLTRTLA